MECCWGVSWDQLKLQKEKQGKQTEEVIKETTGENVSEPEEGSVSSDWKQPQSIQANEGKKIHHSHTILNFRHLRTKAPSGSPQSHHKDIRNQFMTSRHRSWTAKGNTLDFSGVQWLTICLPMQGTGVRSLSQQLDPTWCGTTKPRCQSYWSPSSRTHALQQEKPPQ